jgi:hypothetical protein
MPAEMRRRDVAEIIDSEPRNLRNDLLIEVQVIAISDPNFPVIRRVNGEADGGSDGGFCRGFCMGFCSDLHEALIERD